jgi:hypothetical protein
MKPEVLNMELANTVRVEVSIPYRTQGWQTVDVDLGHRTWTTPILNPASTGLLGT